MKYTPVYFILLSLATFCATEKVRYDNYKVYKVTPRTTKAVEALLQLEGIDSASYNFWSPVGPVGVPVQLMVSPNHEGALKNMADTLEMDTELMITNVQDLIDEESMARTRTRDDSFGWNRYNTLEEINVWLRTQVLLYNENVTLVEVPASYEGRNITGVKISYSPDNANRSVFIESAIHAREWITPAVTTYILYQLLTSSNETIREIAESHDWYIFPVFNPDGYEYTQTDRMWRKTRVPHSILCSGADPNRNWDYQWNQGGTSASPCSEIFRGPQPFSEPSCRVMADYISTIGNQLVAYLSFHSFSQLLLIPYGYTPEHLDNYDLIYDIGIKAADALSQRYGTQYRVGTVYETIYQATGSSADWVKGIFKTPIVYGYELRDLGQYGFLLPPEQIIPTALETMDSLITIFQEYYKSKSLDPASGSSADWVKGTFNTSVVYTYELRDQGTFGFLLPPEQILPTALETLDSFITIFQEYYRATNTTMR